MSERQLVVPGVGLGGVGVVGFFVQVFRTLWLWRFRYISRQELSAMSAHQLKDIGLETSAATRESLKPFWKA